MGIIEQLAIILVAVAAMSLLSERLRISAIPLFMVAGIILGPFEPFPTVIELGEPLYLLAELGVILLLFYLGLEFSLERILQARKLVLTGGVVDLLINGGLGLLLGFALLGISAEAVLLAGIIYVSSSGIITQALFDFRRLADDETDMVLGTLVFEDLAIGLSWRARFCWKMTALSQGSSTVGVPAAMTTGCLSEGLRARKSASLMPARRAITATSMSRSMVTVSKNGWLPMAGRVAP